MNQRHLWTIVALFLTVFGMPSVGRTQTTKGNALASPQSTAGDVVKVGEYQSLAGKQTADAAIAEIHAHSIAGRQAATLFIRNIPVLTFLSSLPSASADSKVGVMGNSGGVQMYAPIASNATKVASIGNISDVGNQITATSDDPVQRAGVIAAKINQMYRENLDASQISVSWTGSSEAKLADQPQNKAADSQQKGDRYTINVNGQELVELNDNTRLADSTNNLAQDALQAANRMRRLIGNASPISEINNLPNSPLSIAKQPQQIAQAAIRVGRITLRGIASWYGYDGSGSRTASGKRFNPEGMTAAHRSLPFGTRVRVTNTRNGRSVVVSITDRGPYIRGRIIDVSAGAARVLGMMGSGVAPVKIEVLGR
ncbi:MULTISPECIES: septal ring lytic transglycosylase RlpA family protein [Calothrix]|uniref:Probable endolytic peptidoglycan transglycosylase RlpA n=2 Tax=Calothrix TaxID=1186 RepID=A0ABR8ACR2_9CYAN|nr:MULTISPECIES: septal ring lytic transglycosylase RlpA family protein [Calothrix]MBD2197684.1 septal ring lytic transglycosylase RlpA family protein [Calothrix parietina FACHB-288]MBD2225613.1 septal ring lytic transglycosylase RlpA family protein [Calothrix anomala FACHB-343]